MPETIRAHWARAMSRGVRAHAAWQDRLTAHPRADEFRRWTSGALPECWPDTVAQLARSAAAQEEPRATILSSGEVCADLEAPTNHKPTRTAFTASDRAGNYVHCGVREHLMGAMTDGIAAHGGLRPINVTYLAFADYERPAMRMAALMGLPGIFVFSHDSIGFGSNGPTHQPVEILASFRAMPNMRVFRPADAVETAEAWQIALETRDGPSLLALSKQPAGQVRASAEENLSRRGAYVLSEPVAVEAAGALADDGIREAVVSRPCWELFAQQDEAYRAAVLGKAPRIGIEAALSFGWERWLRPNDRFVGMTGFGASAGSDVLYEHFGLTKRSIMQHGRDLTGT